jgi:hypothetical protein
MGRRCRRWGRARGRGCGWRRRRGALRGGRGWRCGRRPWSLRWRALLFVLASGPRLSIGPHFALGASLRHDHRRDLRVRRRAGEMHGRQSRGGEQHETKFCHGDPSPRKGSGELSNVQPPTASMPRRCDQQPVIRPDCGERSCTSAFYFDCARACTCACSLRIQERGSNQRFKMCCVHRSQDSA